ncbi:hypothetical protein DM806_18015 [Sphingobium lactosutens]|nr:hypothetical protein [Sphingobium lactosutens]
MDAGDVRIFRHLECALAEGSVALQPHMMDAELLRRFGQRSQRKLGAMGDLQGSAIESLAKAVIEKLVHEQETFDPCRPVALSPCRPVALSPCRPCRGFSDLCHLIWCRSPVA